MNRTRLRDKAARGALRIAKRCGLQVYFTYAGGSALTLWALMEPAGKRTGLHMGETDYNEMTLVIPRQTSTDASATSWPTSASMTGAQIKVNGLDYGLQSVDYDNEDLSQCSTIRCLLGVLGNDDTVDVT